MANVKVTIEVGDRTYVTAAESRREAEALAAHVAEELQAGRTVVVPLMEAGDEGLRERATLVVNGNRVTTVLLHVEGRDGGEGATMGITR